MSDRVVHVDAKQSRLSVRTRASGMLARLAHDLEIVATELSGQASGESSQWTGELKIPVASLSVAGVLRKHDQLDANALSAEDRNDIERRLREEILKDTRALVVEVRGSTLQSAEVTVRREGGPQNVTQFRTKLSTTEQPDGGYLVKTECTLSLSALGAPEVKGPLGAFKVRDALEVIASLVLRQASA